MIIVGESDHKNAERDIFPIMEVLKIMCNYLFIKFSLSSCELLTGKSYLHRPIYYIKVLTDVLPRDFSWHKVQCEKAY